MPPTAGRPAPEPPSRARPGARSNPETARRPSARKRPDPRPHPRPLPRPDPPGRRVTRPVPDPCATYHGLRRDYCYRFLNELIGR
jgi:hypothetical protein